MKRACNKTEISNATGIYP